MIEANKQGLIRIPVVLAGILFFAFVGILYAGQELAVSLFEEGDWQGCRRECLRLLQTDPANEQARLFEALSAVRLEEVRTSELSTLAYEAADPSIRCLAAYELGREHWLQGDPDSAFIHLKYAFANATSHDLFLRAGCTLNFLLKDHPQLTAEHPALVTQLKTSRELWSWSLQKECMLESSDGPGWGSNPGEWIVKFYRSQIGPAIGARCSLTPSCSEYFLQASRKHGLVGVAMIGDRLVREPGVVAAQEEPVMVHQHLKYADPVEEHDWWRRGEHPTTNIQQPTSK